MQVLLKTSKDRLAQLKCRFGCDSPVVGIFYAKEGCLCWNDPVQALCDQHAINMESEGEVVCVVDLKEFIMT